MAEGSIDRISIEVSSDASAAVRSLNSLASALSSLEAKTGSGASKLAAYSKAVASLRKSAEGFNASGLRQLGEVKFSATVPKNLGKLSDALSAMPADAASKLTSIGSALSGLSSASLAKGSVTQLAKLPAVLREFQSFDMSSFTAQLKTLNAQLSPLAANVNKLASAYARLPKSMQTAGLAARSVASSNRYLQSSNTACIAAAGKQVGVFGALRSVAGSAVGKIGMLAAAFATLKTGFEATVGEVNTYIENMNLFEASMGSYTQSATEFAQKMQDVLGIDMGEWARNQGVFQTLITGMGDTAERASVMSQQLTQLGYDIASFYNISVDDAMLKVQSGMAGELEPLRRLGWDLSDARMQLEATKLGIDESTQSMTQAEKVGLRYHMIMTQVTQTHGDMARTIASPANQLRVLQAQLTLAARSIGNLFIPALNMVLPYIIAVVKAVRLLAQSIADLFGIDASFEVDYSTLDTSGIATGGSEVDDLTGSLEDSGDAADTAREKVEEYKNTVMGFDELNKLNAPTESSSSSSSGSSSSGSESGSGSGFSLPLETYDFLAGLTDQIGAMTDDLAQKILGLLPYVGAVAAGLAAWKLASALGNDLRTCAGLAMAVAGAAIMVWNWLDMWNNGIDWGNLLGYLAGMALLVGGLALAFGAPAAAIGGLIGLVALAVAAFHDMYVNGISWPNEIAAAISGLGSGALGEFISLLGNAGAKLSPALKVLGKVASVIGGIISVIDLGFNIVELFDAINQGAPISAENIFGLCSSIMGIGLALAPVTGGWSILIAAIVAAVVAIAAVIYNNWDAICQFFAGIPEWFDTNVIQPVAAFFQSGWEAVCGFFQGAWDTIAGFFQGAWDTVCGIWQGAAEWFDSTVIQPLVAFFSPIVEWWAALFGEIWQTVSDIFHNIVVFVEGCWTTISLVWGIVAQWFDETVIQPVSAAFQTAWEAISGFFQSAWDTICGIWGVVSGWFDSIVIQPVAGFFRGLWDIVSGAAQGAWDAICGAFSAAAQWFDSKIVRPISGLFQSLWDGITGFAHTAWDTICGIFSAVGNFLGGVVDSVWNGLKQIVNWVFSGINSVFNFIFGGINSIIGAIRNFNIAGVQPFAGLVDIHVPQIPLLASGGIVRTGQLFVAREAGPEMVGQMGGKTAVANNSQIVEGIEQGVASGVLKALLSGGFGSGGEDGQQVEIPLVIGSEEIARAVWRGQRSLMRRGEIKAQFA